MQCKLAGLSIFYNVLFYGQPVIISGFLTELAKTVAIMNSTGGVEYSEAIVVGIAFILPLELVIICMLCDNWPVI